MKKRFPNLKSDAHVQQLLESDLSEFVSRRGVRRMSFEFEPKDRVVNLRISDGLLSGVQRRSKAAGIPYQRFIRDALEQALQGPRTK
jgi:predicted DNA binding CopG/RHH family protein